MRILVMQTTRMGDVLQTSPLVRGIKHKHPGAHVTMMVRRMGRTIAERNPDVDDVIVYDEDSMFLDLRAQDSDRLLRAYRKAEEYVQGIRDGRFDVAYNCTHSIASAMLLKLADVPEVVGAHLTDDWQYVLRGPWTNYFFTSVFHREYNDLNLCDITRRFVPDAPPVPDLVFDVREEDRAFAAALLEEHDVGPDSPVICFQLGASESNKRWSEAHFATLARLLVEQHGARIFLLGVADEAPFGEAFEEHAPGLAVHLFGKTTIPQVAALLERASLLVTNDTGTMHLATAVGCPIMLVSVGYVHFRETGPYGAGHCAIEWRRTSVGRADSVPGGLDERTLIRPEQVLRVIDVTLAAKGDEPMAGLDEEPLLATVDVFRSRFAPDGCLQWYPVLRRPLAQRDLLRIAYRAMWLDYLGVQRDPDVERDGLRSILGRYLPPEAESAEAWCEQFSAVFSDLAALAERGIAETERLLGFLPRSARKAQQSVHKLMALDEEMRLFGELHGPCRPLVLISKFERDNLEGADPLVLARTTLQIYRDCRDRAALMRKKLAFVADLSR